MPITESSFLILIMFNSDDDIKGEASVFTLAEPAILDVMIIMLESIKNKPVTEDIIDKMRASNVHLICIDIVRSNYNIQNEDYLKQQIQLIIDLITDKLNTYKEKYITIMNELKEQKHAYNETQDSFSVYLRQRGLNDSLNLFTTRLNEYSRPIREKEEEIKSINKQLKQLPNKKETEEKYVEFVKENEAEYPTV